jgi:plastocyanin
MKRSYVFLVLVAVVLMLAAGCTTPAPPTTPTPTTTPTAPSTTVPPTASTTVTTTTSTMIMTSPPTTAPPTQTTLPTCTPSGSTTIDLVAKNIVFNTSSITVPAGSEVTVHFSNEDAGIPHNFAVYTDAEATDMIFSGKIITGVSNITYQFQAPCTPGEYWFRCDVHPTIMYGTFKVT